MVYISKTSYTFPLNMFGGNMISYHRDNVNTEQADIKSSYSSAQHVPAKPPMKRVLSSLTWTDLPKEYS